MLKITVLNDDRCYIQDYSNSHGLSMHIETNSHRYLFDVGQDDNFIKNANKLNIDLNNIDYIILSHGHYDHSEGLKFLHNNYNLICHPNCFVWRKSKRTDKYNGFPFSQKETEQIFNLHTTTSPKLINNEILFLGQIDRLSNFECIKFPSVLKDGSEDTAIDDTGIAIKTNKGLVIISGCGHSGICNTIEHAKKITKENKIHAVIGGFHLKEIDNQTTKTLEYFKNNNIDNIYLGHCTSDLVCDYFREKLKKQTNIHIINVGLEILI